MYISVYPLTGFFIGHFLCTLHYALNGVMQEGEPLCVFLDRDRLDVLRNELCVIERPMRHSAATEQTLTDSVYRCGCKTELIRYLGVGVDCFAFLR